MKMFPMIWVLSLLILGAGSSCMAIDELKFFDSIQAARESTETAKPIVLFFGAEWCDSCEQMKATMFAELQEKFYENYLWVSFDFDQSPEMVKTYHVTAVPKIVVLNPESDIVGAKSGLQSTDDLQEFVVEVLENPQAQPPSLEELSELLAELFEAKGSDSKNRVAKDEEDLIDSTIELFVEQLADPTRFDRDSIVQMLVESELDCRLPLLKLMKSKRLAIRAAAGQTLAGTVERDFEFDPFAEAGDRETQIAKLEVQLGIQ